MNEDHESGQIATDRNGRGVSTGDYVTDSGMKTKYRVVVEDGRVKIEGVGFSNFADPEDRTIKTVDMPFRSFTGSYWSKCDPPTGRDQP